MSGVYILSAATPSKPRTITQPDGRAGGAGRQVPAKRKRSGPAPGAFGASAAARPAKSNFLANMGAMSSLETAADAARKKLEARSTSFAAKAVVPTAAAGDDEPVDPGPSDFAGKRDESLKLVEQLKMGPYEHAPLPDDPDFKLLEPHSRIRLKERKLAHEDFADMLRGRYFISPSMLYSVARLQPDRSYDVPVDSDWVTVAVVAQRGPIQMSVARTTNDTLADEAAEGKRGKKKAAPEANGKPTGSRFVKLKLIDFGTRDANTGNVRGDAELNLLLFDDKFNSEKQQRTGQVQFDSVTGKRLSVKGPFDELAQLREGAVIALLNPRILKPQQSNARYDAHHILGITPASAESIVILGYAKDLGVCAATSAAGKACGGWYDLRAAQACDYHVTRAVQNTRAQRPEFTANTAGLSTFQQNQVKKRASNSHNTFDPERKTGLLPADQDSHKSGHRPGSETYLLNGHTLSNLAPTAQFVEEKLGRQKEDRKRRAAQHAALEKLIDEHAKSGYGGSGGGGASGLVVTGSGIDTARAALMVLRKQKAEKKNGGKAVPEAEVTQEEREAAEEREKLGRSVFTPDVVKAIGFDPLALSIRKEKPVDSSETARHAALLTASAANRKVILRKPGEKLRSSVVNPTMMNLDDSDDDLEIEPPAPSTAAGASSSTATTPVATEDESDDDLVISLPAAKRRRVSVPEQDVDSDGDAGGLEFPDSDEDM